MYQKILIANRGEIAVRIIRACRNLGIQSIAVYSKEDQNALHTQLADEKVCIGKCSTKNSYLNMDRIISAAIITGADAIHPGYGFLSENSEFARKCILFGIDFIGPSPELIDRMGNKSEARKTMMQARIPVVPGSKESVYDAKEALKIAIGIGFPVMIKASSGGGGKGMRVSESEDDFIQQFTTAQKESVNAFADDTMYIEKYVKNPRHVEVQLIADKMGNVVTLGERDCSVQRNHQKMIEESPSPAINDQTRKKMYEMTVLAAKTVGYFSAGTIEFIVSESGEFYFMEMNTRIQVEHPVTEMVTGIDLVETQIEIAQEKELPFTQEDIHIQGHAIECRINAEIPEQNFRPSPGLIEHIHFPGGNGVRIETAVYDGFIVPSEYDSMLAKIIVHGKDRERAIKRMRTALNEIVVMGIPTNTDFLFQIFENKTFCEGKADTGFIAKL
ncbi:MAG: acetyl-CoA carboxylase biotin carboxylase subunit [Lachnotalea sp.]